MLRRSKKYPVSLVSLSISVSVGAKIARCEEDAAHRACCDVVVVIFFGGRVSERVRGERVALRLAVARECNGTEMGE